MREGRLADRVERFDLWLDLQTLVILFYVAHREGEEPGGTGFFAYRWSEDRNGYPGWPEDPERGVRSLDLVGISMVNWNDRKAVRIEAFETVSMPESWRKLKVKLSEKAMLRSAR